MFNNDLNDSKIFFISLADSKEDLFPRLAYITMENFVNRIERYGIYTSEFILVVAYALNILKMAKNIERTNTSSRMARDLAKIREVLDIGTIEKSLIILPRSFQMVFRNAVRDIAVGNDLENVRVNVSNRFNLSANFNLTSVSACDSEKSVG